MTTKRKNTIAIIVVLCIWGYVAVKMLDYFNAEEQSVVNIIPQDSPLESLFKKDTFDLYLNYEDPFLRSRAKVKRNYSNHISHGGGSSIIKKAAIVKPIEVIKPWPEIKFNGLMKSSNGSSTLGIVNIGTQSHLVRVGDFVSGLKVLSISANNIRVDFNGEVKDIGK